MKEKDIIRFEEAIRYIIPSIDNESGKKLSIPNEWLPTSKDKKNGLLYKNTNYYIPNYASFWNLDNSFSDFVCDYLKKYNLFETEKEINLERFCIVLGNIKNIIEKNIRVFEIENKYNNKKYTTKPVFIGNGEKDPYPTDKIYNPLNIKTGDLLKIKTFNSLKDYFVLLLTQEPIFQKVVSLESHKNRLEPLLKVAGVSQVSKAIEKGIKKVLKLF